MDMDMEWKFYAALESCYAFSFPPENSIGLLFTGICLPGERRDFLMPQVSCRDVDETTPQGFGHFTPTIVAPWARPLRILDRRQTELKRHRSFILRQTAAGDAPLRVQVISWRNITSCVIFGV